MTNEEKAEEIIKEKYCNNCEERETFPNIYNCSNKEHCDDYSLLKEGILLGLAEGKSKWHDLREDPNDLPKESGEFWTKWEDGAYSTAHYFADSGFGSYVIAWCELPKFEE